MKDSLKKVLPFYYKFNFLIIVLLVLIGFFSCNGPSHKKDENPKEKLQVGVYSGSGASVVCILETLEALKLDSGICEQKITPIDIQSGHLDELDVLIFPGGSGSKEFNSLGQSSAKLVKEFAAKPGKGVVGICAGGFLFATTEGYPSLELIKVQSIRDHYNRGRGLISFSLNEDGKQIFPELSKFDSLYIQYYDGPIYEILDYSKINVRASIISDIATHEGNPKGITPGKPAFLTTPYGEGKVFVSVGHPESTPGMRWMVPRMARWVAEKPLISYDEKIIRPEINDREILYFPEIVRFEKENFWKLFSNQPREVISAIENLYSIRSRPSIRWSIGLLRHQSPKIKIAAANYLLETEYTYSIPDLKSAVQVEQDKITKKELEQILIDLNNIINN